MSYLHQGKVVEKKPWSLSGLLFGLINVLRLFFLTIFTTEKMSSHVDEYNRSKQQPIWGSSRNTSGSSGGGPRISGFQKAATTGSCGGGGGG